MIFEASEKLLKKSLNIEEDLFGKLLALLSVHMRSWPLRLDHIIYWFSIMYCQMYMCRCVYQVSKQLTRSKTISKKQFSHKMATVQWTSKKSWNALLYFQLLLSLLQGESPGIVDQELVILMMVVNLRKTQLHL